MKKNVIVGYQIVLFNEKTHHYDDIPNGLYSFIIFKSYDNALKYIKDNMDNSEYLIQEIMDGDIEDFEYYEEKFLHEQKNNDKDNSKIYNLLVHHIYDGHIIETKIKSYKKYDDAKKEFEEIKSKKTIYTDDEEWVEDSKNNENYFYAQDSINGTDYILIKIFENQII